WLASGTRAPEPPKPEPAPPPLATVEVLVAKADLSVGHVVGEHDVGWQTWPADAANSSFIKKSDRPDAIKDFVGAIVRSPVAAGEPIRDSKVVNAKGGFMAAILPAGCVRYRWTWHPIPALAASSCPTITSTWC